MDVQISMDVENVMDGKNLNIIQKIIVLDHVALVHNVLKEKHVLIIIIQQKKDPYLLMFKVNFSVMPQEIE